MALTIAEIAGVINVSIVFLQITFPLLLTFVLIGVTAHTSNAVTWSVTSRLLGGTWWPTILRTDGAAVTNVSKRIIFFSTFSTLGLLLLGLAAILTPLGLYESLSESTNNQADFAYMRDLSPIGNATFNRNNYNTTRLCGYVPLAKVCPGQDHGFHIAYDSTDVSDFYANISWNRGDYISSAIPANLSEIFSSGRDGVLKTVATPFDIQYRAYSLGVTPDNATQLSLSRNATVPWNIDQQQPRTIGNLKTYENSLVINDFLVRDGVIADMRVGGIGFRNHTLPTNTYAGLEWTESLLWIEPESVCINNNVTVSFQQSSTVGTKTYQAYGNILTDEGGLQAAIAHGRSYGLGRVQPLNGKIDLGQSAAVGATLFNYNLALALNATNKTSSNVYSFNRTRSYIPGQFQTGDFDQRELLTQAYLLGSGLNFSAQELFAYNVRIFGIGPADPANRIWTTINGGVILGAPLSVNAAGSGTNNPSDKFVAPVFTCVTTLKAYVKDITFFINGTSSLDQLQIRKAVPHTFSSDQVPTWAIEKPGPGFKVRDMNSLWGIVGPEHINNPKFWTQQSEQFYLPAGKAMSTTLGDDYGPTFTAYDSDAASFPAQALAMLYSLVYVPDVAGTRIERASYYNGQYSFPLMQKWSNLTRDASSVTTMLSLLWTDLMVNTLTSRRGQHNANFTSVTNANAAAQQSVSAIISVLVNDYRRAVQYKPAFAIPAAIFVFVYLILLSCAIVLRITKKSTFAILRSYLNQTSVGRAVLAERFAARHYVNVAAQMKTMPSGRWAKEHGGEDIAIQQDGDYELLQRETVFPKRDGDFDRVYT